MGSRATFAVYTAASLVPHVDMRPTYDGAHNLTDMVDKYQFVR